MPVAAPAHARPTAAAAHAGPAVQGTGPPPGRSGAPPTGPGQRDADRSTRRAGQLAKRVLDVTVSAVLLVLLVPVLVAVALAVLVCDGRPVLYRQVRVGRGGRPFTMVKVRTMVPDADRLLDDLRHRNERCGPLFKLGDDPRVTRSGRWLRATSLDELPQLVNVLLGSMSLVGPRPALYEERAQFPPALLEREEVRPGITGPWQLQGRLDADFATYCRLDLGYVRSWTLPGDLALLARTPFVVLRHAWARTVVERRSAHPAAAAAEPAAAVVAALEPEGPT